jgi:hypothetical protein
MSNHSVFYSFRMRWFEILVSLHAGLLYPQETNLIDPIEGRRSRSWHIVTMLKVQWRYTIFKWTVLKPASPPQYHLTKGDWNLWSS